MAYNRRNILIRILHVQNIYQQYHDIGLTNETIFSKHILPVFFISRQTFYNYLNINAKKELRDQGVNPESKEFQYVTLKPNYYATSCLQSN
jgi:hypothetical protein